MSGSTRAEVCDMKCLRLQEERTNKRASIPERFQGTGADPRRQISKRCPRTIWLSQEFNWELSVPILQLLGWWARQDLNLGPMDYESTALTAELRALQ
jgi:hypothetical protein